MDYADMEITVDALTRNGNYEDAYAYLDDLITGGGVLGAYALTRAGLVRYQESPRLASSALRLMDRGIERLTDSPGLLLRALINGLHVARFAGDTDRAKLYVLRIKVTTANPHPETNPWLGRAYHSLGNYYLQTDETQDAEKYLSAAHDWHHCNKGPFNDNDRRCLYGVSGCLLAGIYLQTGRHALACQILDKIRPYLTDSVRTGAWEYVTGLKLAAFGKPDQSVVHLENALKKTKETCDHPFALRIVYALASACRSAGEHQRLQNIIAPYIIECAHGCLVGNVSSLQRLATTVPSKEGVL